MIELRQVEEYWIKYVREDREMTPKQWGMIYDWAGSFQTAVIIILVLFTFVVRPVKVSGNSMLPTLTDKDWVAVSSISTGFDYGDIVVVNQENNASEPLIKRIIAMGGDMIDFHEDTNEVLLKKAGEDNYVLLSEEYIRDIVSERHTMYDMTFPVYIPEGCVFVMGDNRNNSKDSRMTSVGVINEDYIMGAAKLRLLPLGKWDIYSSYNR